MLLTYACLPACLCSCVPWQLTEDEVRVALIAGGMGSNERRVQHVYAALKNMLETRPEEFFFAEVSWDWYAIDVEGAWGREGREREGWRGGWSC